MRSVEKGAEFSGALFLVTVIDTVWVVVITLVNRRIEVAPIYKEYRDDYSPPDRQGREIGYSVSVFIEAIRD
ncbi:MAG: hypothetical protein SCALA701_24020 [Candidatus Scalindua sp.]|nr:MAG: hypothetical protein SCALA701_24020 [Candidatus Scalindua sp.]